LLGVQHAEMPERPVRQRGKPYLQMKRYEDAIAALRGCIDLRPMEAGAYYQFGRAYQALGKTGLSEQQFDRVRYLDNPAAK
jgi:tetratricopeptide (TPR) repeat protein